MVIDEDKENENGNTYNNEITNMIKTHGAIVKIEFKNFLTYDDVVVQPGPFLNVIIGPNGTGKSTIICGICLAVGGSPKVLGRSDKIGDFIKHGKESGYVKIYLFDKYKNDTNCFQLNISLPNSARYMINNQTVTREEHCKRIANYNIQVDNPCTFLAQDKVKSFAEQDTKQLLKNTEKAGPSYLLEMHKELEKSFSKVENYRNHLDEDCKRQQTMQQNLKTLKIRADNFRELEKRHFKINLLKKKKALLIYEKCFQDQAKRIELMNSAKEILDAANNKLEVLKEKINEVKKKMKALQNAKSTAEEQLEENSSKISDLLNSKSFEDNMADNAMEYNQMKKEYDSWDAMKLQINDELKSIEILWEKAKSEYTAPNEAYETYKKDLMVEQQKYRNRDIELSQEQQDLQNKFDEIQKLSEQQQQTFSNKLHILANISHNRGVIEAWDFYEKNRNQFRFPVYVPFLHMFVGHEKNLIYLNNTIGNRDMSIFIFGCREDEDLIMGNGNRFKINSTVVDDRLCKEYSQRREVPIALKEMGFIEFVSEVFESPLPVRAYLCSVFQLHNIPIGGQTVDDESEKIAQQIGKQFGLFLTKKNRISVTFSRYTNASYVKRSALYMDGLLRYDQTLKMIDYNTNLNEIQTLLNLNKEKREIFNNDKDIFQKKIVEYQATEKKNQEKLNNITVLEEKKKRVEKRLQDYERNKPNIEYARKAFEEKKKILEQEAVKNIKLLTSYLENHQGIIKDVFLSSEKLNKLRNKITEVNNEYENQNLNINELEKIYRHRVLDVESLANEICERKLDFLNACDIKASKDSASSPEFTKDEANVIEQLKNDFQNYNIPFKIDEVQQLIYDEYNQLEISRLDGNRNDVDNYEKVLLESNELSIKIEKTTEKKDKWINKMDEQLKVWLEPLKLLIEKINDNYSRFFKCLNCAGNIELKIAEDKYNIKEYGIVIWVKFRNDAKLRPLTHQTQSGGERSVATMLYLMALQNLCPVPFRCVDEINQGMDPINERRVFNMMVQLLSSSGEVAKTQYFLLTPKLLGGLEFNNRVTVHVVHNGPTMDHIEYWNPEKFLQLQI